MLDIQDLSFAYRKHHPVFSGLNLAVRPGGIYGLLGKNGAGKSTLLYLIAGLLTPTGGSVRFNGSDTRLRKPSTLADIFIVPEEFALPKISLKEYLTINSRFYPNFSHEDLRRHLDTFELSPDINLGTLSMGQKKKAFMCFALACNTPLLLLDEPTNGLDIPGKSRFRKFIVSSMDNDRTIIISTHQVRDIDRVLDHVIITEASRVLLDKSVADILSRLRFSETTSREAAASALFSQPSIGGSSIITLNEGDEDTVFNLECLFEFAMKYPEKLTEVFNACNNPILP